MNGTIYPFNSSQPSLWKLLIRNIRDLLNERQAKKIIAFLCLNVLVSVVLLTWSHSTTSMALTAYTYLTIFYMSSLLTSLLTIWVRRQKPVSVFTYGYERFEVLAVFTSTMLVQLGAFFIAKESVERIVQQPDVHTGRLLIGTLVAFIYNMLVVYSVGNPPFEHTIEASSSSWLQEHVADMSQGLCHVMPGLSKLLLPRINPLSLLNVAGALSLVVVYMAIDLKSYHFADTWAAIFIAVAMCGTMFPMASYSGKILLQTTPSHIIGQLDKLLREASTLDGVLEFRNEHFWTLSFGSLAGSVHVRIRRDANEQMVLAHVSNRLRNLVSDLTVQVFKDDWARISSYQMINHQQASTVGYTQQRLQTPIENSALASASYVNNAYQPNTVLQPIPGIMSPERHTSGELNSPFKDLTSSYMPSTNSNKSATAPSTGHGLVRGNFKPNYDLTPGLGLGQTFPSTFYNTRTTNTSNFKPTL